MTIDKEIIHAGILGMKWGHRKSEPSGGGTGTTGKAGGSSTAIIVSKTSKDYDVVTAIRKKKLSELSNDDIKVLANRMQLEQSYKQYQDSHKTEFQRGKDVVLSVLGTSAKNAAGTVLTNFLTKKLGEGLDKASGGLDTKLAENVTKKIVERATQEAIKRTAEKQKQAKEKADKDMDVVIKTDNLFYGTMTNGIVNKMRNDSFKLVSARTDRANIVAVDKAMGNLSKRRLSEFDKLSKWEVAKPLINWSTVKPLKSLVPSYEIDGKTVVNPVIAERRKLLMRVTDLDF